VFERENDGIGWEDGEGWVEFLFGGTVLVYGCVLGGEKGFGICELKRGRQSTYIEEM